MSEGRLKFHWLDTSETKNRSVLEARAVGLRCYVLVLPLMSVQAEPTGQKRPRGR